MKRRSHLDTCKPSLCKPADSSSSRQPRAPLKILPTMIFNESDGAFQLQPIQVRKTLVSSRKGMKSANNSKQRVQKENKRKRPSSVVQRRKTSLQLKNMSNLNSELEKVLRIFHSHWAICPRLKTEITRQGGSRLFDQFIRMK